MTSDDSTTQDPSQKSPHHSGADDDLLDELRRKTAELAGKVTGHEGPDARVLEIDDNDPLDILTAVETDANKPHELEAIQTEDEQGNPAVALVRQKLARLYKSEPDAETEAREAEQAGMQRSKHQQYMYNLSTSGKSLADIQTEWHTYYVDLSDEEKHIVWKEFYALQPQTSKYAQGTKKPSKSKPPQNESAVTQSPQSAFMEAREQNNDRSVAGIKNQLLNKVNAGGKLRPIHHFKSLLFGVGMASVVGLIITFTFFNEVFIAPFISPSQSVSATPIIGPSSGEVGPESKIIIPKINLDVPVVFDMESIVEDDIQDALEDGVVHYATTPNPGEIGNSVIVGHSSNNILNSGKYKFAFVLLKRLEPGDLFYVHNKGVRYTYKVYDKKIVPPTDLSVLGTQSRANTTTLITCDPPGTSINRLIVFAEQIDPNPAKNSESSAPPLEEITGATEDSEALPSNAPSLWSRLWPF